MFFDYKQKHPDNLTTYGRIRVKKNSALQNSEKFLNRKESLQNIKLKTPSSEKDILSPYFNTNQIEITKQQMNQQNINEKENDFQNYRKNLDNNQIRTKFNNNENNSRLSNKEFSNLNHTMQTNNNEEEFLQEKENDFENYRKTIDNKIIRIFGNKKNTARLANKECSNFNHISFKDGVMLANSNEEDLEKIIKKKKN